MSNHKILDYNLILKTSKLLNRSPKKSILLNGDFHKIKKEIGVILENNKEPEEKYGEKLWYYQLRVQEQKGPNSANKLPIFQ